MKTQCHFEFTTEDDLYQICSCRRHAWSCRAQRVVILTDTGCFNVTTKDGGRYKLWPYSYIRSHANPRYHSMIKTAIFFFYMWIVFLLVVFSSSLKPGKPE